MSVTRLDRVIVERPGRTGPGGADHPMRRVTLDVASGDPAAWSPQRAAKVAALFDSLASEWAERDGEVRHEPLDDALARGGPFPQGLVLELGCGTGTATPSLVEALGPTVAADLSHEMIVRADPAVAPRLLADAARLPLVSSSVSVLVLQNMLLFPHEVDRVMAAEGVVIWVNTLGDLTPIHLSARELDESLPGEWDLTAADAGWGWWAVARRRTSSTVAGEPDHGR